MRGIFLKRCWNSLTSPHDDWTRKLKEAFPLPPVKRQKSLGPTFPQQLAPGVFEIESREDNSVEKEEDILDEGVQIEESAGVGTEKLTLTKPNHADVPSALQADEIKPSLYPSVVYEGNSATVKLGVGQMVRLEGCAMVQVLDGQAAMLGYSFPRGADVLVCSSSKPAELITIEARHTLRGGRSDYGTALEDTTMTQGREEITRVPQALGCQLRFASHTLGQQILASGAGSGRSLSFGLEFVGSLGSSLGMKSARHSLEQQNEGEDSPDSNESCSDDDQLNLESEAGCSDSVEGGDERDHDQLLVPVGDVELAATTDIVKKRKGREQITDSFKRQRVVDSATSVPQNWKDAVETITLGSSPPVIAIAVQRMLESLRLLGS